VTLSLPDALRSKLRDEGIADDETLLMTGDELVERIGGRATYELVVALEACSLAIAHYPGRRGRRSKDDQLRTRNIEILRMRLVERMSHTEIGQAVGLSRARVPQILHNHFGLDKKLYQRTNKVTIPVEALALVREALRMYLLSVVDDLHACLSTGEPDMADEWKRLDLARGLLRDVDTDDDVEVFGLVRDRGTTFVKALRNHLAAERYLGHDADAAMIERLLSAL
jgi:hypothetical protein